MYETAKRKKSGETEHSSLRHFIFWFLFLLRYFLLTPQNTHVMLLSSACILPPIAEYWQHTKCLQLMTREGLFCLRQGCKPAPAQTTGHEWHTGEDIWDTKRWPKPNSPHSHYKFFWRVLQQAVAPEKRRTRIRQWILYKEQVALFFSFSALFTEYRKTKFSACIIYEVFSYKTKSGENFSLFWQEIPAFYSE